MGSKRSQQQQAHQTVMSGVRQAPPPHSSRVSSSLQEARKRDQQNLEQQQRAAIKASFGSEATQLRFTNYLVLAVALILLTIAFFSTNWLEVERRFYGSKFNRLGLWRMCFNSFSAPDDYQFRKFYAGCRWIFADEYKPIRKYILPGRFQKKKSYLSHKELLTPRTCSNQFFPPPPLINTAFFIVTQVLFSAGFLLLVLVCAGIIAVQQCFIIEREDYALRALSVASLLSAISCTSAVTTFAINATRDDWMPDPEHNYLSWSFAAALIGSILLWIAALLFYIDMQLTVRRELRQGSHSYASR